MNAPLLALRRLTWWVTVGCLLAVVVLTAGELAAVGRTVVVAVGLPAVAGVCAAAGVLFAGAVLGRPVLRPAHRRGVVIVAALAAGVLHWRSTAGEFTVEATLPFGTPAPAAEAALDPRARR